MNALEKAKKERLDAKKRVIVEAKQRENAKKAAEQASGKSVNLV